MPGDQSNEGRACDAVIKVLENSIGCSRTSVRFPERDGEGPPVEVEFMLGDQRYSIEHTTLETFSGQTRSGNQFQELVEGLAESLDGKLPSSGLYDLYFPIDVHVGGR